LQLKDFKEGACNKYEAKNISLLYNLPGVARTFRPRKRHGNSKVPSYKDLKSSSSFNTVKGESKTKQVKLAEKARKPQAAKNGPKKPFPCDLCKSSFPYPGQLKLHIYTVHLGTDFLIDGRCSLIWEVYDWRVRKRSFSR
jgi:hypothetical protein